MPVIVPPTSSQPTFQTTADPRWGQRQILRWGNSPLPVLGTILSWIDLNDGVNWFAEDILISRDNRLLDYVQQNWRLKSTYISDDFAYLKVKVPTIYDESTNPVPFLQAIAPLTMGGEQYLTFDNSSAVLAKCKSVGEAKRIAGQSAPYAYKTELEFWVREPWLKDLNATTNLGTSVLGGVSGITTTINQVYSGTVFAEPVYTIRIPSSNTVTVSLIVIKNATSNETITIPLNPALTANAAHVLTVDCINYAIYDDAGKNWDGYGSFPMVYGNPQSIGTPNSIDVTITASGATTGVAFDLQYYNRYVI